MKGLNLLKLVRSGVQDVLRHKLRSFLTMLGMVFGVGSVVAMLAVGEGASEQALEAIRKLGSHNILLSSVKPPETGTEGLQRTERISTYGITYEDEKRILETVPGVLRTVPARFMTKKAILGSVLMELRVVGTTDVWFEVVPRPIVAGRVLTAEDRVSPVCVLTESGARKLLAGRNTIGQAIRLARHVFTVVGIVKNAEASGGMQMPDSETDVYIPIQTGIERFGQVNMQRSASSFSAERVDLNQVIVEMKSDDDVKPGMHAIEAVLAFFHKKKDYRIDVPLALLEEAAATKRRFNAVLGSIAAISLLVGGIGIMNIMLASVTERTQEIGIRRAIGARRRHIVFQFLVETCVLSIGGGIIGLVFGVGIPMLITLTTGMPTSVRAYSLVLAFSISAGIGIVFGLYPAHRASMLDPVEALRRE
jgi:putative ABC transport system permease protein